MARRKKVKIGDNTRSGHGLNRPATTKATLPPFTPDTWTEIHRTKEILEAWVRGANATREGEGGIHETVSISRIWQESEDGWYEECRVFHGVVARGRISVLEGGKAGLCTLSFKLCRCLQLFGLVATPLPSGAHSQRPARLVNGRTRLTCGG